MPSRDSVGEDTCHIDACRHCLTEHAGCAANRWQLQDAIERFELEYVGGSPYPASRPIFLNFSSATYYYDSNNNNNNNHDNNHNNMVGNSNTEQTVSINTNLNSKERKHNSGSKNDEADIGWENLDIGINPAFPNATTFQTNTSDSLHFFLKCSIASSSTIDSEEEEEENHDRKYHHYSKMDDDPDPTFRIPKCKICLQTFVDKKAFNAHQRAPAPLISSS
eukprot:scaffold3716_cov69-Cylindrotheca_fusiformis.AAC.37